MDDFDLKTIFLTVYALMESISEQVRKISAGQGLSSH